MLNIFTFFQLDMYISMSKVTLKVYVLALYNYKKNISWSIQLSSSMENISKETFSLSNKDGKKLRMQFLRNTIAKSALNV